MDTQIMGRTTDVEDLEYLKNMAMKKTILLPELVTGEWVINGVTVRRPTKMFVRDLYSVKDKLS